MTGPERVADGEILTLFKNTCNYHKTQKDLKNFRDKVLLALKEIEFLIEELNFLIKVKLSYTSINDQITQCNTMRPQIKVPLLTLPSFDGTLTKWTGFWEHFKFAIHELNKIDCPATLKHRYLVNCL